MFLKSFKLFNYRKFGEEENEVLFAYEKLKETGNSGNNDSDENMEKEKVDISPTSTLIIGKNNSGKTSVIYALQKLIENQKFSATDFNFNYLHKFLMGYKHKHRSGNEKIELPEIKFKMEIIVNDEKDIISNVAPLLFLKDTNLATLYIKIKIKEEQDFIDKLESLIASNNLLENSRNNPNTDNELFRSLIKAIDEVGLVSHYFNNDNQELKDFKLSNLIKVRTVDANAVTSKNNLTNAFNKIIEYRHRRHKGSHPTNFEDEIDKINKSLTKRFKDDQDVVNKSVGQIEHPDKLTVSLSADLTHEKILQSNVLVYEYLERNLSIPENQYGLGYTNLVTIIAKIMEYIEKEPANPLTSVINIITIEEPETYMHPQMQELFIKNINAAIGQLLEGRDSYVNSQIIITTHSSHILNSKIHSGNSFNYINYLTEYNGLSHVVNLDDDNIVDDRNIGGKRKDDYKKSNLEFLKKHIKYKVAELFFSDAIIFVEGVTEETLVRYWLDHNVDQSLKKYYISVFNIDGAHGLVYHKLIKQLKIPALIITDLDIKVSKKSGKSNDDREQKEGKKASYEQICNIQNRTTTNPTLKVYFGEKLKENNEPFDQDNLIIVYQTKIEEFYPTSFEEALILSNYRHSVLKVALEETRPIIFKSIHEDDNGEVNDENIKKNSRLLQEKLSKSKSEFANRLLFGLLNQEDDAKGEPFTIPNYIQKGLELLSGKLKGE